jgi:ABC-type sugar transport system permease subunit
MAISRKQRESRSFLVFAKNHVFVTIFGVVVPVVLFLCLIGYPIVYTIYLSFFEWNGMAPVKKFVGLANYAYLTGDKYFYVALFNNLKWLVVSLIFPVTMSLIAVGLMFLLILNPIFGAFDTLLRSLGLGFLVREWFGDFHIALYTLTVISGWAFTGLPMIFYFAGLGDVPKETIDAARIEGAGHFRMITGVALPQLRPVTAVVVMLTLFESFKAFDLVAVLTKGAPFGTTNVLGYLVYLESFWNSRFGYGATLSVAILVLSVALAALLLATVLKGAFRE